MVHAADRSHRKTVSAQAAGGVQQPQAGDREAKQQAAAVALSEGQRTTAASKGAEGKLNGVKACT
eukprot:10604377-Alexandrium_andersonii.AAC.1